jgi:hypothetical protein
LASFRLIWESLKYLAKANDVADLANSEGWIVKLRLHTNIFAPRWFFQTETIPLTIIERNQNDTGILINFRLYPRIIKLKEWSII